MARRLDVVFRREDVGDAADGRACLAIDVLRAATNAAAMLAAGAQEVRLFLNVEDALEAKRAEPEALLAGERKGLPPKGFDLGNSPREPKPETVGGRTVLFSTTNGTALLASLDAAAFVVFGGLVNAGLAAKALAGREEDILLACAGTEGRYSGEDALCAGLVADRLLASGKGFNLTDGARMALAWARGAAGHEREVLESVSHGRLLASLGMGADLEVCAATDSSGVLPVLLRDPLRLVPLGV